MNLRTFLRPSYLACVVLAAATFAGALTTAITAQRVADVDVQRVHRPSYAAGWAYVVARQPDRPGAASPWLRTDPGMHLACTAYVDGYAQLDGVTDPTAFLAGCDDAAALTDLQPATVPEPPR